MTQLRMPLGMLQNPMGVLRGPPNVPRGPLNVPRGPLGLLRGQLSVCLLLLALFSCQPALGDHLRAFNLTEATFSNRTCFSCSLDFRYVPWQGDHPCLGWTEPVATDYLVQCGGHQPICQETWFVQSGILLLLSRGCTDSCAAYCKSTGFGVTRTTCNLCCERDGCNDHPPSLQATATGL